MFKILITILLYFTQIASCSFDVNGRSSPIENLGSMVKSTEGEIWPKPKLQTKQPYYSLIRPHIFKFEVIEQNCDLLEKATLRYIDIIRDQLNHHKKICSNLSCHLKKAFHGYLDSLQIKLTNPCQEIPELYMDESYKLIHKDGAASIESESIWGVLRGLESFSQMLVPFADKRSLRFNETKIIDEPRFSHRGLLIDTSRHYLNILTIYRIIDGMAYNKLNVLHWHIVDDQSFPYESVAFPELSVKGAFHPLMIYTQSNISNIIEYARLRGIRVMPEFDTPGHTNSWGESHPELITMCSGKQRDKFGPFNPIKQQTYDFMEILLREIKSVFPEKHIHLGGDEVDFDCWANNKNIRHFSCNNRLEIHSLESIYMQGLIGQVTKLNGSTVVWEDVFRDDFLLPQSTIVQVWKPGSTQDKLSQIMGAGYKALISADWYLDYLGRNWEDFYRIDPHDFSGSPKQKSLVLGGEACMWGENTDDSNVIQRIFPRVSAVAERLWSYFNECGNHSYLKQRFEEHKCRMIYRGIPSQSPNNCPGFCV